MADENNSNEDGQFVPDGSMEPLSPQEADNTDYGLMVGERVQKKDLQQEMRESYRRTPCPSSSIVPFRTCETA